MRERYRHDGGRSASPEVRGPAQPHAEAIPAAGPWSPVLSPPGTEATRDDITPAQIAIFAAACGLAVANIYYSQPLVGLIAPSLGLAPGLAGLIVTLTQLGYGAGLLFLVPLSDVIENRRLVICALGIVALGLLGIALSDSVATFMVASFVVGVFSVAVQILVPLASHLAPEAARGRVVGTVMSGLLVGVMLARPFSSYVAATSGWRMVFYLSAGMMLVLLVLLARVAPRRRPGATLTYTQILRSLPTLVARTPVLRRRAFYQAMLFAGFNLFWTGSPLLLAREFGLGHRSIALFALAGAAGALAAPIAGRLADRGLTRPATGWALAVAVLSFAVAIEGRLAHSLSLLVIAALMLDAAVQVCQVLSLRSIYMLAPELRGRLNGLFMACAFVGGAAGSGLAAALYTFRGWTTLAALGALCTGAALTQFASEFRRVRGGAR
jgi:predicted MFS family arabinose efflux permease